MGTCTWRQLQAAFTFIVRPLLLATLFTVFIRILFSSPNKTIIATAGPTADQPRLLTKALVVASTGRQLLEDVSWLADVGKDWRIFHYVTDAPLHPDLSVPVAKGNEAMAYLTYIIDHYDHLPDIVLFHHSHRRAWHQAMDSLEEVRRLRPEFVARVGYASTRCLPGCENVIPLAPQGISDLQQLHQAGRDVQLSTLLRLFLGKEEPLPSTLASPCCAQFAASRAALQRHSQAWWRRLRQWLMDTPVDDAQSGRLLEHTWHVWLGNETYHCPEYDACRCHVFGMGDCEKYFAMEERM